MWTDLLLRCGEIFLKGKNRPQFEKKLRNNLRKKLSISQITQLKSRLLVPFFEDHHLLGTVFGLTSYSPARRVKADIDQIKKAAVEIASGLKGTFKVETQRSDKRFPIISPEVSKTVGSYVEEHSGLKFSFSRPEHILYIEINVKGAFLFIEKIPCFGGLPTGIEGSVVLLVEDETSLLAGLLLMKRGCHIFPVAFEQKDISLLEKFSPLSLTLKYVKDFAEIESYAKEKSINVLVLGQIFGKYEKCGVNLAVLRPLVAYDDQRVRSELEEFKSV